MPQLDVPWLGNSPSDHVPQNAYRKKWNFMNIWGNLQQTHNDCPRKFLYQKLPHSKFFRNAQTNFPKSVCYPRNIPGKETVSDCKGIGRNEPSFNIFFIAKNIVDPCEIYMDGTCKWSLTTGLRFIGYVGIGKFLLFLKIYIFLIFTAKNTPLKQTHRMKNFSCFQENKLCQLIRRMIGFIQTNFKI